MDKPFKTIEEQIEILHSRGVSTDGKTSEILAREGYYSVVNGYKDLFLDKHASEEAGCDVFDENTKFQSIYRLFTFDRELRQTLFGYFAKAEASLKTQCAYHFMEAHQGEAEPYLVRENYSTKEDDDRVSQLISDFSTALGRNPRKKPRPKAYIEHYRKNHDEVPLWVLMHYMTLGAAFKFYCYQEESMRNKVAKGFATLYSKSHGQPMKISPDQLRKAFDRIKDFRNICAHGERLYCARVSPSLDTPVVKVLPDLRLVLSREESARLTVDIVNIVTSIANDLDEEHFLRLIKAMGFGNIQQILSPSL